MSASSQPDNAPGAQATVKQHLDAFRSLLISLAPEQRANLNTFWKDVRQSLNDQDAVVSNLQEQLNAAIQPVAGIPAPPNTPARPHTSNSVNVIRDTVEQAIINEAQYHLDASATLEAICDLDKDWAMDFIKRQRNLLISNSHELGCWMSGNVAGHDNGYVKMNMRNTVDPRTHAKFGNNVQPWGHQMGVVASGYGMQLRLTTTGAYHVSSKAALEGKKSAKQVNDGRFLIFVTIRLVSTQSI